MSDVICIYHASCTDGFGAAWAVREFYKNKKTEVKYHAAHYNRPAPDVTGKDVIIVDFSYPVDMLRDMSKLAKTIVIIDHHKTAIEALQFVEVPHNVQLYLSEEYSGAMLAWLYFFTSQPPELIKHIQDRDLWKFKFKYTKEIMEAVNSYDMDFETWDLLMAMNPQTLAEQGSVLLRKTEKTIESTLRQTPIMMSIASVIVPVYNITHNISETLNKHLLAKEIPFAASFFINPEGCIFSLRSLDDRMDVSEIAKFYGGGGHRNASGFKVSLDTFQSMLNYETRQGT